MKCPARIFTREMGPEMPEEESVAEATPQQDVKFEYPGNFDPLDDELLLKIHDLSISEHFENNHLDTLRDLTFRWSTKLDSPIMRLRWPPDLFIPGEADYKNYWVTPPPHDHVFQRDWTNPAGSPNTANNGTGQIFAYDSPASYQSRTTTSSTIAIEYTPTAAVSQVIVRGEGNVLGQAHQDFSKATRRTGLCHGRYFGTLFLLGWMVDSLSDQWERLPQVGRVNVFYYESWSADENSLQQYPVSFTKDQLSARFLVERGKKYVFGVSAQVSVEADVREFSGTAPYTRSAGEDLKLWCNLGGALTQMTVDTTFVSIP